MYAVNQARLRPTVKPFVPDDKNADFEGYEIVQDSSMEKYNATKSEHSE